MINTFITSLFTVLFFAVWSLRRMFSGSTRHTLDNVCIALSSIFVSRCRWPSSFDHCPLAETLNWFLVAVPTVFEPNARHMLQLTRSIGRKEMGFCRWRSGWLALKPLFKCFRSFSVSSVLFRSSSLTTAIQFIHILMFSLTYGASPAVYYYYY